MSRIQIKATVLAFTRNALVSMKELTSRIARRTRLWRKIHRWISLPLLLVMLLTGGTGVLLGWKKQAELLPPTQKGASSEAVGWIGLDSIVSLATVFARDSLRLAADIDRIDVRPQKGIAKIIFAAHFTELQIDCSTGRVLSVAQRHSDLIERIHDGSLADQVLGTGGDYTKLTYTTLAGLGLIFLSISGFWLWFNPIRIKKLKQGQ